MAAFTMVTAEARAIAKGPAGDRTWLYAHACRLIDGTIAVRLVRPMPPITNGDWVTVTDDAAV